MNGSNRTRNFKTIFFQASSNRQKYRHTSEIIRSHNRVNKRPPTAQKYRLKQTGETSKRGGSKLEGQEINLARAGKQQQRYWTAGEGTAAGGASKM